MTDRHPTRFENYPPETPVPFAGADPAPATPTVLSAPPLPEEPARAQSRRAVVRGLLTLVIAVPVVGALGLRAFSPSDTSDSGTETGAAEPMDDPSAFTVGDYGGPVPRGWELVDDGSGDAVLVNGANRVTVQSWPPDSGDAWPADDITGAVNRAGTGFKGTLGKPVNESTGTRTLATLSGKGTFQGLPAREFAELWLDDNDTYLLIITVLTAEEGSATARQATDIAWNLTSGLR
jgi:hypothetical protein